ncbi:hypothetical protein TNCV_1959861 [Trichonephila clavipes]|nr:hypothetical protein TNCV_1959861 [Trichonephila clavipes]
MAPLKTSRVDGAAILSRLDVLPLVWCDSLERSVSLSSSSSLDLDQDYKDRLQLPSCCWKYFKMPKELHLLDP